MNPRLVTLPLSVSNKRQLKTLQNASVIEASLWSASRILNGSLVVLSMRFITRPRYFFAKFCESHSAFLKTIWRGTLWPSLSLFQHYFEWIGNVILVRLQSWSFPWTLGSLLKCFAVVHVFPKWFSKSVLLAQSSTSTVRDSVTRTRAILFGILTESTGIQKILWVRRATWVLFSAATAFKTAFQRNWFKVRRLIEKEWFCHGHRIWKRGKLFLKIILHQKAVLIAKILVARHFTFKKSFKMSSCQYVC